MEFDEIIKRLKSVLSNNNTQKIYDKDIAAALGLEAQYFTVMKKRKKIPFREIAIFCNKKEISINWILFESN
jgi:DNA-binding Xre family transcriptional regulator